MSRATKTPKANAGKHTPVSSQADANLRWCESMGGQGDGGSIGTVIQLMTRVMDLNPHSFGWDQIVAANKVYELDFWLLEKLAERYLSAMENFGILERVPKEKSCYDSDQWYRLA
jgi:hypothetical protein